MGAEGHDLGTLVEGAAVYPPADGLEYSTQSVTFITASVSPSSYCPICQP
ncbi:hypothetical protein [Deinococcus sp. GbtcB9]|nr:hypothetical protein [Deinococcus sp. GbtcB9]